MDEKYKKIGTQIGFSYFILGLQMVSSPIIVALLTRILGAEKYGVYVLFSVFSSLALWLIQPGLSQYLVAKLPSYEKRRWPQIFFSLLCFELILASIIVLIFYLSPLSSAFLEFNKLGAYSALFGVVLTITLLGTLATMLDYYYRAKQSINVAGFMEFVRLRGWAFPLIALFFMFGKFGLMEVFAIWAGITFFIILTYMWLLRKELLRFMRSKWLDLEIIKPALAFGIPIIPSNIFTVLLIANDRYILNYYHSSSVVGIYSVAYSVLGILLSIALSAGQVILPYFAEAHAKDKKQYKTLLNASLKYGLMLVIPGIVGAVALRSELVTLIAGPKYLAASQVIIVLMLYPVFALLMNIGNNSLLVKGETRYVAFQYLIGLVINFGLNIFLVPRYGMYGAAFSLVFSYFIMAAMSLYKSTAYKIFNYDFLKMPQILLSSLVMGGIISFINPVNIATKLGTIGFGAAIYLGLAIATGVINRKEIELVKSYF